MVTQRATTPHLWYIIGRNGLLVFTYYLLSIGLTFYQNHLLKEIKFPLSIVCCHLVIKFILASVIRVSYEVWKKKYRTMLDCWTWFRKLSLVGISSGLDIGLSNWSQEYVTVSLYTMTKSTAVIFILFFALALGLEERHWSLFFIVSLISGGLTMFTYKSTQFHLIGFCLVLSASFLSGFRWSMAQLILQRSKLGLENPVDMIYHIQPWMLIGILPFAIFFEGGELLSDGVGLGEGEDSQRILFAVNAIGIGALMAFFMECTEYLLLIYTSSLSLAVAGIFKEICTMILAVIFNHDPMTFVNFLGLLLCLSGILAHLAFKFSRDLQKNSQVPIAGRERRRTGEDVLPLLTINNDEGANDS